MYLKVVCAWCGKLIGVKHYKDCEEDTGTISHSICPVCKRKVLMDIEKPISQHTRPLVNN